MRSKVQSILKEANKVSSNLSDKQLERNYLGGKAMLGVKLSDEAKINMSLAQTGRLKNSEHKAKISKTLSGRKLSTDTCNKMSESRTGLKHSSQTIKKLEKAAQKRCVAVSQFTLDGVWIKDFIGLKEAGESIGKENGRPIQLVCNYYRDKFSKGSKQCGGFIWKYKQ
jgi:hypothetical protein